MASVVLTIGVVGLVLGVAAGFAALGVAMREHARPTTSDPHAVLRRSAPETQHLIDRRTV